MAAPRKSSEPAPDGEVVVRVTVAANTQVNNDGHLYGGGETLELPEADAAPLLAAGIVVEAK